MIPAEFIQGLKQQSQHFEHLLQFTLQQDGTGALQDHLELPHHMGTVQKYELNLSRKGLHACIYVLNLNFDIRASEERLQLELKHIPTDTNLPNLQLRFVHQFEREGEILKAKTPIYCVNWMIGHDYIIAFTEDLTYELPSCVERVLNGKHSDALESIDGLKAKTELYLAQLINSKLKPGIRRNMYAESKILGFLHYLFQYLNEPDQLPKEKFTLRDEEAQKVHSAKAIILQELQDPPTIAELAKKVGLNENYLKRGFKSIFNYTIHDYIQHERMENAKSLLGQPGATVSQVAYTLGFSCVSHFSAAFKKNTGVNPSELISN